MRVSVQVSEENCIINAVIDSGSSIFLIRSHMVGTNDRQSFKKDILISGINGSQLNIEAVASTTVSLIDYNISKKQVFYVVDNLTISSKCSWVGILLKKWIFRLEKLVYDDNKSKT